MGAPGQWGHLKDMTDMTLSLGSYGLAQGRLMVVVSWVLGLGLSPKWILWSLRMGP